MHLTLDQGKSTVFGRRNIIKGDKQGGEIVQCQDRWVWESATYQYGTLTGAWA